MDTDVKGQVGGLVTDVNVRKQMAKRSVDFACPACKKSNRKIMDDREEAVKALGEEALKEKKDETVPEELRLAYREDLKAAAEAAPGAAQASKTETSAGSNGSNRPPVAPQPNTQANSQQTTHTRQPQNRPQQQRRRNADDAWIDSLIYTIGAVLSVLILKKVLSWIFP